MPENKKKPLDLPLLLPIGLLVIEIIVVIVLRLTGYEISQYLFYFFILLGVYLAYQILRQLLVRWRVRRAVKKQEDAIRLAETGQPFAAIDIWKKSLLQLPRDKYLETLDRMQAVYEAEGMKAGAQQVKAIRTKSNAFFEASAGYQEMSRDDKKKWQSAAYELRNMINALPEKEISES